MVPPFVPFAQTFAAAITAALTGSLYYIATAPKGITHMLLLGTKLIHELVSCCDDIV
jgi:hypothetical protein